MSDSYEIGYGKPPKAHRFKKGQSGNPEGGKLHKKRKLRSLGRLVEKELQKKITLTEEGKTFRITKIEYMAKRLAYQVMKGDLKALNFIMSLGAAEDEALPRTFEITMKLGNKKYDPITDRLIEDNVVQSSE
jgi:hypothetical protein